ncbi:MAG: hypothetical protein ACE361_01370 [Aureliella sp.]
MPCVPVSELTPEQRFQQIAALLAKGVIRCQRQLRAEGRPSGDDRPNRPANVLEDPDESRLSVS